MPSVCFLSVYVCTVYARQWCGTKWCPGSVQEVIFFGGGGRCSAGEYMPPSRIWDHAPSGKSWILCFLRLTLMHPERLKSHFCHFSLQLAIIGGGWGGGGWLT